MTLTSERIMWGLTAFFLLIAGAGWILDPSAGDGAPMPSIPPTLSSNTPEVQRRDVLAARIVARNVFRLGRRPSDVPFGMEPRAIDPMVSVPARPTLILSGVFGPPWQAVLEGVPGREGSLLVREGDTVGGMHIRSIGRDTVVLVQADSSWKIARRRTW